MEKFEIETNSEETAIIPMSRYKELEAIESAVKENEMIVYDNYDCLYIYTKEELIVKLHKIQEDLKERTKTEESNLNSINARLRDNYNDLKNTLFKKDVYLKRYKLRSKSLLIAVNILAFIVLALLVIIIL